MRDIHIDSPVDDICQITWAEMRREVGQALTERCKAYCRQLETALQELESNIETFEILGMICVCERHVPLLALHCYFYKEMKLAKDMVGQLARALPQLEAEHETYEEGRPFPNAWHED